MSGEFAWIDRFFRPLAGGSGASLSLRDDAAVLEPPEGRDLVLTADCLNAGVHFLVDDLAEDIAFKLLRVNLSDLAAMGARPLGYLLTLALPNTVNEDWLADFARGLAADQGRYGIALLGGDTTRTKGPLSLSLTAIGSVPAGRRLSRTWARPGDAIFVSGTIGDAALGLKLLTGELDPAHLPEEHRAALIACYHRPTPRLQLGAELLERGLAAAAIDVSDGLIADLRHLAEGSDLAAVVEAPSVPLSEGARSLLDSGAVDHSELLGGGDDYELLFAVPGERIAAVEALGAALELPLSRIGQLTEGAGVSVRDSDGRTLALAREGWVHV